MMTPQNQTGLTLPTVMDVTLLLQTVQPWQHTVSTVLHGTRATCLALLNGVLSDMVKVYFMLPVQEMQQQHRQTVLPGL